MAFGERGRQNERKCANCFVLVCKNKAVQQTSAAESVTVVHILSRCIASCYISGMQPRQFVEKPVSFKVLGGLEQFFSKHLVNTALKKCEAAIQSTVSLAFTS